MGDRIGAALATGLLTTIILLRIWGTRSLEHSAVAAIEAEGHIIATLESDPAFLACGPLTFYGSAFAALEHTEVTAKYREGFQETSGAVCCFYIVQRLVCELKGVTHGARY